MENKKAQSRRLFDFVCEKCGSKKEDLVRDIEEEYPVCCGKPMKKALGTFHYHQSFEDWNKSNSPGGLDFTASPLTRHCVEEGLRRRRQRLGGTGRL